MYANIVIDMQDYDLIEKALQYRIKALNVLIEAETHPEEDESKYRVELKVKNEDTLRRVRDQYRHACIKEDLANGLTPGG